jgi:hypothetical protein
VAAKVRHWAWRAGERFKQAVKSTLAGRRPRVAARRAAAGAASPDEKLPVAQLSPTPSP